MANNYQQVQVHHIESLTVFTKESNPSNGSTDWWKGGVPNKQLGDIPG